MQVLCIREAYAIMRWQDVCLSVYLSVMFVYCLETDKHAYPITFFTCC